MKTHINVTVDFTAWMVEEQYDVRIPIQQPAKQLIMNLAQTLKISVPPLVNKQYIIRIENKQLMLFDDDMLSLYPITDGDILTIL